MEILLFAAFLSVVSGQDYVLKLTHILYRHGDRTPTHTFPKDNNTEDTWPQGFGMLTQRGMREQQQLGRYLRNYYSEHHDGFLNTSYIRQEIYIRSTDKDRTLESAYCTLAGLYPPKGAQRWSEDIRWQPISVHTVPLQGDNLLSSQAECDRYDELTQEVLASKEFTEMVDKNKEFIETVSERGGWNDSLINHVWDMYDALKVERLHGREIPDWVTPEVDDQITELDTKKFAFMYWNEEMQRLRAGVLLNEWLEHLQAVVSGELASQQKAYMYSAHDTTLTAVLRALNIWNGIIPPYTATVLVELVQEPESQQYFVEILYKNDSVTNHTSPPHTLQLPGCDAPCPLAKFVELVEPMTLKDWSQACRRTGSGSSRGAIIAIGVIAFSVLIVLVAMLIRCWVSRKANVRYHSANFSNPPA